MNKELVALREACNGRTSKEHAETLRNGPTTCLLGRPSSAEKGFISLALNEWATATFDESSVVEVLKERDDLFLVTIRSDANVIVKFEATVKAATGCCEPSIPSGQLTRTAGANRPHAPQQQTWPPGGSCTMTIDWVCVEWVDKQFYVRRICLPVPVVKCPDPPILI